MNEDASAGAPAPRLSDEIAGLERRLGALLAHTRALRVANEALRRDLAACQERNRHLVLRMEQAAARVDALIARIPADE
jgi:uncharacterized protein (TIGR02449 family)